MEFQADDLLLVTGATGLVGSHVAEEARRRGVPTRALVRAGSVPGGLEEWGVESATGELTDADSLRRAVEDVTAIVHCAAKVGDWGPVDEYRAVNVRGLEALLDAAESTGRLRRFVHVSSLGVYAARDHHGTDETEPPSTSGIDGYTLSKVEAERLVLKHVAERKLPATVLRPGFVYGPRDRTVLPRLLLRLREGKFAYLGDGTKLMNNTFVGNLVEAVFAAFEKDAAVGQVYNIRDGRAVSKREFMETICGLCGYPKPTKHVPLGLAKVLARVMEGTYRLLGRTEAPLLSGARIKFLGLNLDYAIDKARRELRYDPAVDFAEGMQRTIDWFRATGEV